MGVLLVIALAVLFGAHVAIAAGLARRRAWGKAALALVVAPLAPWWGWREGMRARAVVWLAAVGAYGLGVIVA
jgi:hypothetical protein